MKRPVYDAGEAEGARGGQGRCDGEGEGYAGGRLLRQTSLAIAFDKPVSRGQVAKGLSFDPIADPEMGISSEIQPAFFPRLLQSIKLCQGRGEEAPRAGAMYRLIAQSFDRGLILAGGILSLPETP